MPRTKEQNMAIRAKKKQLIMDTAMCLFAENGFENTGIDSIAKNAGISTGLLYAYFDSKEDLLHQILVSGIQQFSDNLFRDMTIEDFLANVEKSLDHLMENRQFYKLYYTISLQPKVMKTLTAVITNEYTVFQNTFSLFRKHFGEDAVKEMLLFFVISKGFGTVSLFGDKQDVVPIDSLKKVVMDFLRERYLVNY
jgi:AcrR family transcriptional regulator